MSGLTQLLRVHRQTAGKNLAQVPKEDLWMGGGGLTQTGTSTVDLYGDEPTIQRSSSESRNPGSDAAEALETSVEVGLGAVVVVGLLSLGAAPIVAGAVTVVAAYALYTTLSQDAEDGIWDETETEVDNSY